MCFLQPRYRWLCDVHHRLCDLHHRLCDMCHLPNSVEADSGQVGFVAQHPFVLLRVRNSGFGMFHMYQL